MKNLLIIFYLFIGINATFFTRVKRRLSVYIPKVPVDSNWEDQKFTEQRWVSGQPASFCMTHYRPNLFKPEITWFNLFIRRKGMNNGWYRVKTDLALVPSGSEHECQRHFKGEHSEISSSVFLVNFIVPNFGKYDLINHMKKKADPKHVSEWQVELKFKRKPLHPLAMLRLFWKYARVDVTETDEADETTSVGDPEELHHGYKTEKLTVYSDSINKSS
jgi:hypothetical protein